MKILRKELLSALKVAQPGLGTKSGRLGEYDAFVFSAGHISAYNGFVCVAVPFDPAAKGLEGAVSADEFYNLVNRLTADEMKITVTEDCWKIKCGKSNVELKLLGKEFEERLHKQFSEITSPDYTWDKLPKNFLEALSFCVFGKNVSVVSGVFISGNKMTSTDESRINWIDLDEPMIDFWISNDAGKGLLRLGSVKEYGTGNTLAQSWVHFRTENGVIFSASRLKAEKYPFEQLSDICMKHLAADSVCLNIPKELIAAVNRASSFAISSAEQERKAVRLSITSAVIRVHSESFAGKYKEDVDWDAAIEDDFEKVSVLIDYMMAENCMKKSKVFSIKHVNEMVRAVFDIPSGIIILSTFLED